MSTYAAYLRVSSREQQERETIKTQLEALNLYAKANQIKLKHVFADDGVSGSVPMQDRMDGSRLLETALSRSFDTLLVFRIDRISRNAFELLRTIKILEENGVSIKSITEPFETNSPVGRFTMTMLGGLAQMERDAIRDRSEAGMRRGARNGRWMGGRAPFGYKVEDGYLKVNETEASIVREIFSDYLHGQSTIQIAESLNARSIPVSARWRGLNEGAIWHDASIQRMLHNELYTGVYKWNKQRTVRTEGKRLRNEDNPEDEKISYPVPAIIDDETFEQAQKRLTNNLKFSPRNSKRIYILRGLVKCGVCGYTCTGSGADYAVYSCASTRRSRGVKCSQPRIKAKELEEKVWNDLVDLASDPQVLTRAIREEHQEKLNEKALVKRRREVSERLAGKANERVKILSLLRRDVISETEAEKELKDIEREQGILERELRKLGEVERAHAEMEKAIVNIDEALKRIWRTRKRADAALRMELIRGLVSRVTVYPGEAKSRVEISYIVPEMMV